MPPQQRGGSTPPLRKALIGALACAFLVVANGEQGQTRIRSYAVNTTIENRFARTHVAVDFLNEKDCATVRGFTMHLPMNARVASLSVEASNQCVMNGEVKALKQAQQEFDEQVAVGKPAALLQSWDEVRYPVWVSLPPVGTTRVEIDLEELLHRRNDQITFQVPLFPGSAVDELIMDVSVSEPDSGVANFDMDSVSRGALQITRYDTTRATAHLELTNVAENELKRLITGTYDYDPVSIPDNGIIIGSRKCVSHLFNPSASLLEQGFMPRNIVFVIDVSGSMQGQKIRDAKSAFSTMIQSLTTDDFFTIHTFSSQGTKSVWGPSQATSYARDDAKRFVMNLEASGGTNLYDAFGDGLKKVSSMQAMDEGDAQHVPILVILTDGQATSGITSSREIARFVRNLNAESVGAKIFALAFGEGADLPLLLGICIQNGGKAVQIYEGYDDSAEQMEDFYEGEIGRILLADVKVQLSTKADIAYQTQTQFPVFPSGSEVFVRARTSGAEVFQGLFRAVTTATSVNGPTQWTAEIDMDGIASGVRPYDRECLQSFAHSKITEVLRFRDAAKSLGEELKDYVPYPTDVVFSRSTEGDIVSSAEAHALELAVEAGLVWPGLTAMVTIENDECTAMFAEGNAVCTDGEGVDEGSEYDDADEESNGGYAGTSAPGSAPPPADKDAGGDIGSPPQAKPAPNNGFAESADESAVGDGRYPDYDSPVSTYSSSSSIHLSFLVAAVSFLSVLLVCGIAT